MFKRFSCIIIIVLIYLFTANYAFTETISTIKATNPQPAANSLTPSPAAVLSWTSTNSATSYNVYFGTDFQEVQNAEPIELDGDITRDGSVTFDDILILAENWLEYCTESGNWCYGADLDKNQLVDYSDYSHMANSWGLQGGNPVFKGNQIENTFNPGLLTANTKYYWRIDEVINTNTYVGDVWQFETGANDSLIGWWKLDETTGSTAYDSSGYGNDGIVTNPSWSDGQIGNALNCDGNGYVTLPTGVVENLDNQVTVAFWCYGDANALPQKVVPFCSYGPTGGNIFISLPYDDLDPQALMVWACGYETSGAQITKRTTSTNEFEGQWNHWAFTKNTTTGEMKIYLNGSLWHSGTGLYKFIKGDLATIVRIGCSSMNTSIYEGKIDDVRIYSKELSTNEIKAITADGDMVAWWEFDEGCGTSASDSIDNHNGTINNAYWDGGKIGYSLNFDGTGYVSVPADAINEINEEITVMLWAYGNPDYMPTRSHALGSYQSGSDGGRIEVMLPWDSSDPDANIIWRAAPDATDYISKQTTTASEFEGQWNHWAFTKNTNSGDMKIYQNGVLWHSGTGKTKPIVGEKATLLTLGAYLPSWYHYHGKLDDIRIYKNELDEGTINAIYNWGLTANRFSEASNPYPENESTAVYPVSTNLTWTSCNMATSHKVYFGTDPTPDSSEYIGVQSGASYQTPSLSENTTYYWRIDEISDEGTELTGNTWSFTTGQTDPNLCNWWNFDESEGTVAYASVGDYNCNLIDTVWVAGHTGSALAFDGLGTAYTFNNAVSDIDKQVTVTFWAKGNDNQPTKSCAFLSTGGNTFMKIQIPSSNSGTATWYAYSDTSEYISASSLNENDFKGDWKHWAFTKNTATGEMAIYQDGQLWYNELQKDNPINASNANTLYIGSSYYINASESAWECFEGALDDFRIYNIELSKGDIKRVAGIADKNKAYRPTPSSYSEEINAAGITLSWKKGDKAAAINGHDVYIGTSYNDVNTATLSSSEYKGRQSSEIYTTGNLNPNNIYYWRIDEIDTNGTVTKGDIWAFLTETDFNISIESDKVKYVIDGNCRNIEFSDKTSPYIDYLNHDSSTQKFAKLKLDNIWYPATRITNYSNNQMTVMFDEPRISVVLDIQSNNNYFTLDVNSVSNNNIEELIFVDIDLINDGTTDDLFPAYAMPMNYETRTTGIAGSSSNLQASCVKETGIENGKIAVVATNKSDFRNALKAAASSINDIEDLAVSSLGGPWAIDNPDNYGSYLFCTGNLSASTVNDWINMCLGLGVYQIDFIGHTSMSPTGVVPFRYGDYELNPTYFPNGKTDLASVITSLHNAGIKIGLHNYSFFISKECSYVTPTPNINLAYDAVFTLNETLDSSATTILVDEDTIDMSSYVTGGSSCTLRIGNELITYTGVNKTEPDYSFTGCTRGAYGTTASSHPSGTEAYNLREYYSCFLPEPESALWATIAQNIAELYNDCGFDMLYMDALDGAMAYSSDNNWSRYYAVKFCQEVFKRLNNDPIFDTASRGNPYIWFLRSRIGAEDYVYRSYKQFIDNHVKQNKAYNNILLPQQLGWWYITFGLNNQIEPSFTDVTEYLCTKAIGYDSGLSFHGSDYNTHAYLQKTIGIINKYETIRLSNYFSDDIKKRFQVPGENFIIEENGTTDWNVYTAQYDKHKVEDTEGITNAWKVWNRFGDQPIKFRIEALQSANNYTDANNKIIADFDNPEADFTNRLSASIVKDGSLTSYLFDGSTTNCGCFTARNSNTSSSDGTYIKMGKTLSTSEGDLDQHQAMGVWVYGDNKGEILNFQLTNAITGGKGEHYLTVDFEGWRYFELIEPDAERYEDYKWPYPGERYVYRHTIDYNNVKELNIWYNNLPINDTVTCYIKPVKGIPTNTVQLQNCSISINNETMTLPCNIESGMFLEFYQTGDCKLYNSDGSLNSNITPTGTIPTLKAGENTIIFNCTNSAGLKSRCYVTMISKDENILDCNKTARPIPENGKTEVSRNVTLSWIPGVNVQKEYGHNVYFGTSYDAIDSATTSSSEFMGSQTETTFTPETLDLVTTYYWRVDEVNDKTYYKGDVWQFETVGSPTAELPEPVDGKTEVVQNIILSWTPGANLQEEYGHNVYFGTSYDAVDSATTSSSEFMGSQTENSFNPGTLDMATTYYWRIDEVNGSTVWKGNVWQFRTSSLVGWWKLDQIAGTTAYDSSGFGNDGIVTNPSWVVGHKGIAALDCNGSGYVTLPTNVVTDIDEQITVSLWCYGHPDNMPQRSVAFCSYGLSGGQIYTYLPYDTYDPDALIVWAAGYETIGAQITKRTTSSEQFEEQWNHWAFTKNTSSSDMKIYLNGNLWHYSTGLNKSIMGNLATEVKIGCSASGSNIYQGIIDDVRIYKLELNHIEIQNIHNE